MTSSTVSFSQDFAISVNNKILLQNGCKKIEKSIDELRAWKQADCSNIKIEKIGEGKCVADVSSCLDSRSRKLVGKTTTFSGPNCWNTALLKAGLVNHYRETSEEEFDFYLKSPLCRELSVSEIKRPGDIGSIESRSNQNESFHVHGFIHVSDEIVYNKAGIDVKDGFKLESYEKMHQTYPVGELAGECLADCGPVEEISLYFQDKYILSGKAPKDLPPAKILCALKDNTQALNSLLIPFKGDKTQMMSAIKFACREIAQRNSENKQMCKQECPLPKKYYYRCQETSKYISSLSKNIKDIFSDMETLTNSIEKIVSNKVISGVKLSPDTLKLMNDDFILFINLLDQFFPKGHEALSSDLQLVVDMIFHRWQGIDYTLRVSNSREHPLRKNMLKIRNKLRKLKSL
jgi:hypothetical protein